MKTIKNFLIAIALFGLSIFSLQAQNTEGTEFWLTFGSNNGGGFSYVELQIRIAARENPVSGTIYFTNINESKPFEIGAWGVFNHILTPPQKAAVYNTSQGKSNYSIKITSDKSVTVYALNQATNTTDATNILPVTALGDDYYQISYKTYASSLNDGYAVVAVEDNTQVYHNGTPIAEGVLNKGQVYYRQSPNDMTGTRITSNNPVAFFVLNQAVIIPDGFSANDCFFQQLAPVITWGKNFFVPVSHREIDRVRIVASQDNTTITPTQSTLIPGTGGQYGYTINAGQFIELETELSFNGCYITADKPIGVCTYLTSMSYNLPATESDPSICWLPSIEQAAPEALISPFLPQGTTQLNKHFALIITPTATKNDTKVSINGAAPTNLSGGSWKDHLVSGMSFYTVQLSNSSIVYHFTNSKGLLALGYGVGWRESYYYLSYSAMRDLQATFSANDISYQLLKENDFCEGDVHFLADIEGLHPSHPDRITWWIDGTEYLPAKTLDNWNKYFSAGTYEIRMDVIFDNYETASKTGTLIIKSCNQSAAFFANNVLHSELKDTTFCNKTVNFRTEIEGLHPTASDSIMWYINDVFETSAATWNKTFENGTYEIKLVVHYDNDTYATLTGTLKIQALWIKIRNVRY